ncbi:MAG TPA: hypothetical protein VKT78_02585 [Fimbriimonadaceae bacterium]|nr:hypothetical protein [Fimbriimonadaceae bacterium]
MSQLPVARLDPGFWLRLLSRTIFVLGFIISIWMGTSREARPYALLPLFSGIVIHRIVYRASNRRIERARFAVDR